MTRSLVIIPGNGDGIWYEGDEHQAVFRWQLSDGNHTVNTSFNFAVTLYPDGRITFQYGDMIHDYPVDWAAGISDGDMTDYLVSGSSLNDNVATIQDIGFRIPDVPTGLTLSQDGLLSGILAYPGKIDDIRVMVTDRNNISDSKPFQLSSGLFFDYFILAGDDSIINRNEDVTVGFDISNLTGDTLHQAFLSASVDDPSILLTDSVKSLGTLLPFQTLSLPEGIRFRTGSSMPDGYNIPLDLTFTSEERSWNKSLILVASAPRLAFGGLRVDDAGNGILEGGETADLIIKVDNLGHCPAHGVACRLSCLDPFISMNQSPWLQYGDIPERSCKENEINITVNPNTPEGYFTWIHATICDSEGWHTGDSIYLAIGNVPILIVDLDKNLNSGPVIRQTILENHLGVDYRNFSPWWDLYKYDVVFLCLGIFPNHYKLDSVAASYFVSYLNAGGRLYLEGGATWHNDHPTALQPMFNIEGDYVGYPHPPDTLIGQPSTFTQDISMHYTGEKARIANLYPLGSAFSFFNDLHTGYSYGVAFDTVGYKTIGTSFEFGGLYDSTYPSVKTELMRRYLDFFGITTNALAANFTADTLTLQAGTVIPFHDLSTKDVIAWNWTFNGGTPSSSSEPEPVIRYDSAGIFDVTLTVSNGDHNNTLTKKGYITVFSGHGVEDLNRDMAISIFPNPTEGRFILTVLPAHPRRLSFSIVNNIGQMILKKEPLPLSFAGTVSFDLGNRPSGMYFIIVNDGDRQIVKKVVLMR
jgi:PKD repeat protein